MWSYFKKFVTFWPLFSLMMLVACRHTEGNANNFAGNIFPGGSDLFILGGALVLLFLVPVIVLYWPKRKIN